MDMLEGLPSSLVHMLFFEAGTRCAVAAAGMGWHQN